MTLVEAWYEAWYEAFRRLPKGWTLRLESGVFDAADHYWASCLDERGEEQIGERGETPVEAMSRLAERIGRA